MSSSFADLAIVGAAVTTLDPARPTAQAIAVRAGRIVAVGSDAEIRAVCDGSTEVIDLRGASVVPGLTDGHIHPFWLEQVAGADLTACGTLAEVRDALAKERERIGDDGWLLGWGLEYGIFGDQPIDSSVVADVAAGAPTLLTFFDQHTGLASDRALELAGVSGAVSFSTNSEVVLRDGVPTGELREMPAMDLVRRVIPKLTDDERLAKATSILRGFNAVGLTGLHAMNGNPGSFDLVRELEARGDLTLRTVIPFWQKPDTPFEAMEAQLALRDERGELWRGGVAKFFIDGVIDTGTGWLVDPDTEGDGTASYWPDPEAYRRSVALFTGAGFGCTTHACGDMAVRYALDAYRDARGGGGAAAVEQARAAGVSVPAGAHPLGTARHRIEHIETIQLSDIARFAAEDVAASMQPLHMQWVEPDGSDSWSRRLGPERAARGFLSRDLHDAGAVVPLGSDWPVASFDPRIGMAWARLRREAGLRGSAPLTPGAPLTPLQTLHGYTTANARMLGEEHHLGRIRVGFHADLTAFAADPLMTDADDLPALPVVLTVVGGRVVHRG
jgi:predicted amidohydrolase YtcJ